MVQQNDCSEILDLIPDYAFGLTDAVMTRRIEAALPDCPEAAEQLAEYQRLQVEMRASVPQIAPPPALALRLREAIRAESAPDPTMILRGAPPVSAPDGNKRRAEPAPPRSPRRPLIAAAALIALALTNVYWFNRVNSLSAQMQAATTLLAQFQNDTFAVRDAETLELARLDGVDNDGFAMMMWDGDSPTGLIYTRNFPQTERGKVYQLWLSRDGVRVSGGTFTVSDEGDGALVFTVPDAIEKFDHAGITEEPEGGSSAPTTSPVVSGDL